MTKIASITIKPFESALLKNQAYISGNPRLGHTDACTKAMQDIFFLMRAELRRGFEWNEERIQVTITAYRANVKIDAQNLVDSVSDALESALHVDDRNFDVAAVGKMDKVNPRIVIELTQEDGG